MDVYMARQPIYDRRLKVFAYELLYRNSAESNVFSPGKHPDFATISVIIDAFLNIGLKTLTNNKPGFINFTENLLLSDAIKTLPAELLGIEILESIDPSEEVLRACGELKKAGYTIMLDDYVYTRSTGRFIRYADIIKMDFMQSADAELRSMIQKYSRFGIKFVAEKIETKEDFSKAWAYGYDYFQGYFFQKPSLIQKKDLLPIQANALKLLEMLQRENCDVGEIASVVGSDPGMAYKLFRLANSVMYGGIYPSLDIRSAVMRIGLKELRTWILYIMLYGANENKPDELIRQSMLRSWAAEEICLQKNRGADSPGFSLLGLFSLMDVIMDAPFETILSQINISEKIKDALICPGDDLYGAAIRMIRAYDGADWDGAQKAGRLLGISLEEYQRIYLGAVSRCDRSFNELFHAL